jgi:DNA-binding transcriptional LysR family regulator
MRRPVALDAQAAGLLCISPGAVSQPIRNLEDRLAIRPFERTGREIVLTGMGRALFDRLTGGFGDIESMTVGSPATATLSVVGLAAETHRQSSEAFLPRRPEPAIGYVFRATAPIRRCTPALRIWDITEPSLPTSERRTPRIPYERAAPASRPTATRCHRSEPANPGAPDARDGVPSSTTIRRRAIPAALSIAASPNGSPACTFEPRSHLRQACAAPTAPVAAPAPAAPTRDRPPPR